MDLYESRFIKRAKMFHDIDKETNETEGISQ